MEKRIKLVFYLKGNHNIIESINYTPASNEVTEEDFQKEIYDISNEIISNLNEGIYSNSSKTLLFGNTAVKMSELVAYQIYIEDVENMGYIDNIPVSDDMDYMCNTECFANPDAIEITESEN